MCLSTQKRWQYEEILCLNDNSIVYTLSTGTHFSFANIDNYTSAREEIVSEVLSFIESVISK